MVVPAASLHCPTRTETKTGCVAGRYLRAPALPVQDERERTEARSVHERAQTFSGGAPTHADRQIWAPPAAVNERLRANRAAPECYVSKRVCPGPRYQRVSAVLRYSQLNGPNLTVVPSGNLSTSSWSLTKVASPESWPFVGAPGGVGSPVIQYRSAASRRPSHLPSAKWATTGWCSPISMPSV